ncbi:hypothetical protein GLOIN_2v1790167 [Rhizophagus irregularis DAOM 181602=DAOM 197198]|nr:hypothetical protein GLOIN_2v1790167 [Rhizophagus irregularis DAOM 181602=DAOM 197198]
MYRIENHTISQIIFNLIENIKQNLNYLTIRLWNYQDSNINLIILQDLGQTLPPKLEYLSLALNIKAIDFKLFLKSSQDTFFKKLVISNVRQEDGNYIDILPYVKEYIMKKKRAKYLAIKNTFTDSNGALSNCHLMIVSNVNFLRGLDPGWTTIPGYSWVGGYPGGNNFHLGGGRCFADTFKIETISKLYHRTYRK